METTIEFTNEEIRLLNSILLYMKFELEDEEAIKYAGSPYFASVLNKIFPSIIQEGKKVFGGNYGEDLDLSTRPELKKVKDYIKQTGSWRNLSYDEKINYIQNLSAPYVVNSLLLHELIAERDQAG